MGRVHHATVARRDVTLGAPRRPELGDTSQVASARAIRLADGSEDGVRAVDVRVAGGIHALVLLDRGLDIGPAWFAGYPLSWQSPTGIVHPAYFGDDVWLRSFHGGLMFTAGLQNVGSAVRDGDAFHGLHGRVSNLPARDVVAAVIEDDLGVAVVVKGSVRETSVYGVDLVLHRRLTFRVGSAAVEIDDRVENRGYTPAPVYLLYHVNLGHPVIAPTSRLVSPAERVEGWDEASRAAEADHATFHSPAPHAAVQVFEHHLPADAPAHVTIAVVDPAHGPTGGLGVAVTYDRRQLPRLWQWRMLGEGLYLTGLEPANCGLLGRVEEARSGASQPIQPGEVRPFAVQVRAVTGTAAQDMADGAR